MSRTAIPGLVALLLLATLSLPAAAGQRTHAQKVQAALRREAGPRQAAALEHLLALRRRGELPKAYLDGSIGRDSQRVLDRAVRQLETSGRGQAALPALRAAAADLRRDGILGGDPAEKAGSASRLGRYRFSAARYADHIRMLSGERAVRLPAGRLVRLTDRRMKNRENQLGETLQVLRRYYQGLGLEVRERPFVFRGRRQVNLEVLIPGRSRETIVLGAHYDTASDSRVRREQPDDARSAAPGADDNGTGVAALMEAARALRGLRLEKTVRLVHFSGEEEPSEFGSGRYVRTITRRHEPITAAIIVDAIGFNRGSRGRVFLHTPLERRSLQLAGAGATAARDLHLPLRPVGRTPDQGGVLSVFDTDTAPFVSHHVPALFVCEDFSWRRGIHDRFDRIDRIDLEHAGRVVTAIGERRTMSARGGGATRRRRGTVIRDVMSDALTRAVTSCSSRPRSWAPRARPCCHRGP